MQLSYAPLVKQVTPAVVNVYATKTEQGFQSPFQGDPFFSQLFGNDVFQSRPQTSQSLGSGVIVDPKGVIVTNSHVVNGADEIHIALSGGREYPVKVLLDDPKSDLAVLQIADTKGKNFPALSFANSDDVEVGDLVLAIGNPFGVGQTVTSGIVSALARSGVESGNFDYFIQTDAAINPGNSGGALVDLQGHLVGINTAIFSRSGGSVGIGFAIPANMARAVAEAGEKGGPIVRPWFGARLQEVTSDIADSLNIDPPHGALITEVAPGSPAANAGLKSGDAIIKIDGVDVDAPQGFDFRFATKDIGTSRTLPMCVPASRGRQGGGGRGARSGDRPDRADQRQYAVRRHDGEPADAGGGAGHEPAVRQQGRGGDRRRRGFGGRSDGAAEGRRDRRHQLARRSTMWGRSSPWSRRERTDGRLC